jgi:hypothetical protein
MRLRVPIAGAALVLLVEVCLRGAGAPQAKAEACPNKVINQPGQYVSPDGTCHAALKIGMGEAFALTAGKRPSGRLRAKDVTGMIWFGGHTLVYTGGPIYGIPGVYVYSCDSDKVKRIIAPRTITKAYPDGADFFELEGISSGKPATVYFYYAPDVDKVNFETFLTPAFLYQVHLDGSEFRKAQLTSK